MKHAHVVLVLALALLPAVQAGASERNTLRYGGGGQGSVVFDGPQHASKGFTCKDCHLSLFATAQRARIAFQDHFRGKSCFACHNQVNASRDCGSCHRKFNSAPLSVTFAMPDSPQGLVPPPSPAKKTIADLQSPLVYEGVSTIGAKIVAEAAALFTRESGIPFGAIGGAGADAGLNAVAAGRVSFGGLAGEMSEAEKARVVAWQVIGYDVAGVFVHPANPIKALRMDQLKEIFTGRADNWKHVGGPDLPIVIYNERLTGGRTTARAFKDMVLGKENYGKVVELAEAVDCIAHVAKDPGGITVSPPALAAPGVVAVAVNGVLPRKETVQSGAYVLKRPLHLITLRPTGNIQAFFDFMMTPAGQAVVGKNFVPVK